MDIETLKKVFAANNLTEPQSFRKINVGFTNTVYAVDEQNILKVCNDSNNEKPFTLEAKLYEHFKNELPVPQLIAFDGSKSVLANTYMLYPMITGENLYNIWHTYSDETRKGIVKQLCEMLQHISSTDAEGLSELLDPISSWKTIVLGRIEKYKTICTKARTVTSAQSNKIGEFCAKYSDCLDEQKIALVYWDAHFDNILVKDSEIVGLLDFERTELASIDFTLDIVKRMVDFPKKYMSEYAGRFAKPEDYAKLLDWYKDYYPELFDFAQLERRLDFYSLAHDLEDLENWPSVKALKDNIDKVLEANL